MMDGLMDTIKVFFNGVGVFFIIYLLYGFTHCRLFTLLL